MKTETKLTMPRPNPKQVLALKDIRDIQMVRPPLDIREQEAKIRNLERQFTEHGDTTVTVTLAGEVEQYGT